MNAILKLFLFLGNRTPKQVSSRVQKYFIKLSKAGLPIPGRGPKVKMDIKKNFTHKQRNNNFLLKRSTFFPHQNISFDTSDESKERSITEESVSIFEYFSLSTILLYDIQKLFLNDITSRRKIQ